MYSIEDVYVEFRRAQSTFLSRPYRIPKDLEKTFSKMNPKHYSNLEKLTQYLNTCYHNICPEKYFACGFQLFGKTFSYHKFFHEKIMKLYIIKDKNSKRDIELSKKSFLKSLKFILKWIGDRRNKNISLFVQYSHMTDDGYPAPIRHFNMNMIDKFFLVWLMKDKYFQVDDSMKNEIALIIDNFRELSFTLEGIRDFINSIKIKVREL